MDRDKSGGHVDGQILVNRGSGQKERKLVGKRSQISADFATWNMPNRHALLYILSYDRTDDNFCVR